MLCGLHWVGSFALCGLGCVGLVALNVVLGWLLWLCCVGCIALGA